MNTKTKINLERRKKRVFHAIRPKSKRMRLAFIHSNQYLHTQLIDDKLGKTLCCASTSEKSFPNKKTNNKEAAHILGELIADRAKKVGVAKVILDRRGRLYHGCIAKFSDAARGKGLEF